MTMHSWPFELDPVHVYAYAEKVFSKQECEQIIRLATKQKALESTVFYKNKVKTDKNIRQSQIRWLAPAPDFKWVFQKITDITNLLNDKYFKFDIFGAIEGLQFTSYKAPGGKYGKHVDRSLGTSVRKLSITIQLSDPKDYKGGELCFYDSEEKQPAPRDQGTFVVFPSFVQHEVLPVTKGERHSLVCWITGKPFK
jgi:PKHD-type hydroxylase